MLTFSCDMMTLIGRRDMRNRAHAATAMQSFMRRCWKKLHMLAGKAAGETIM